MSAAGRCGDQDFIKQAVEEVGGTLHDKKSESRELTSRRLGLFVERDQRGQAVCPNRMGRLIAFTLEVHEKEVLTVLEVKVIRGLGVPALQCRRACMSCFHEIWKQLHRSRDRHVRLNGEARDELLLAIALAPLMVTKLGSPCSAVITGSDASLEESGVCSASALSNKGSLALAQLRSHPLINGLGKIVLAEVSSGIGGGRRAFDLAALHEACFIAPGASRSAATVIESCWPDAHQFDHVKGSVSRVADCIFMLACRAAHVLVIFGATHRSLSGKAAKERVDGLTIEGLKLTQSVHISLCHLKVRRCTLLGTALACPNRGLPRVRLGIPEPIGKHCPLHEVCVGSHRTYVHARCFQSLCSETGGDGIRNEKDSKRPRRPSDAARTEARSYV
jgi:hypothetical protein